jgi:hypothetical protein
VSDSEESGAQAADAVLLVLEWLGEQGVDAMIRVDADRVREGRPAWTFAAGGGPLAADGRGGLRADARTAEECLRLALAQLREAGLDVPA